MIYSIVNQYIVNVNDIIIAGFIAGSVFGDRLHWVKPVEIGGVCGIGRVGPLHYVGR
jgi:hypothetical protein